MVNGEREEGDTGGWDGKNVRRNAYREKVA